jgi:hypothetical protein
MTRISLLFALAVALGFAMPGAKNAQAASAMSSPALALGQHLTAAQRSNIVNADVSFRLYVGPRYRRYRHYRRYRRYRRPGVRIYIGPRHRRYRRHRRARSCRHWHRRCVRNWGYGNSNYYGCMRYHGCR